MLWWKNSMFTVSIDYLMFQVHKEGNYYYYYCITEIEYIILLQIWFQKCFKLI